MSAEIRPQAAERESEIAGASNRANQCHGEIFPVWPNLQRLFRQLVKRRTAVRETLPVFRVTCGRDAVDFRQLREIANRSPSLARIMHYAPLFCTSGELTRADIPSGGIGVR
jgi:hypothetical protein